MPEYAVRYVHYHCTYAEPCDDLADAVRRAWHLFDYGDGAAIEILRDGAPWLDDRRTFEVIGRVYDRAGPDADTRYTAYVEAAAAVAAELGAAP